MSDIITALTSLFGFLVDALGDIADFFTSSTLGLIILGIAVFGVIFNFIMQFFNRMH